MKGAKEGKAKKKVGYRGDVPGCTIGQVWEKRADMMDVNMHNQSMAGIDGREDCGCYSIVMSAGYEDDVDNGDEVIYTGCGGQNIAKDQEKDQEFKGKNASLCVSCNQQYPVRVIRGFNCPSPYAPPNGYRYDGLYLVESFWQEKLRGFLMCRYRLKRIPGQPPLPPPRTDGKVKSHKKRSAPSSSSSSYPTKKALRSDAQYLCIDVASAARQTAGGVCVVCKSPVSDGCGVEHIEQHIKDLWNEFEHEERLKLAQRAALNYDRISSVEELLESDKAILEASSSVYVWP